MKRLFHPKNLLLVALLGISVLLFAVFSQLLMSRYHYQHGVDLLEQKNLIPAHEAFNQALLALPGFSQADLAQSEKYRSRLFTNDLQRIDTALGELFFLKADQAEDAKVFIADIGRARDFYQAAAELNPHDIEAATGLAKSTAGLETIHRYLHKNEPSPYNASPLFERALKLRPRGIETYFLLLQYLDSVGKTDQIPAVAKDLVAIYPSSIQQLKTEQFYSAEVEKAIEQGLQLALANEQLAKAAYAALSDIARKQGRIGEAVEYFSKTFKTGKARNTPADFVRMGGLYLLADEPEQASASFLPALWATDDRDAIFRQIWESYRSSKKYTAFLDFCGKADEEIHLSELKDILQARCLLEMEQFGLARSHLIKVTARRYQAESAIIQARIAEKEQNWDDMEISSHKATVLEPTNAEYHSLLSQALKNQKKYAAAEEAISQAIAVSATTNPWLYSNRGWIRWSRENFEGARADWLKAISIDPLRHPFYYYLAIASEREKDYPAALKYARYALKMAPDNAEYLKKIQDITTKSQSEQGPHS